MDPNENPVIDLFGNCYDSPVMNIMPLANIPISYEENDVQVHTLENGYCCGDPLCYCADQAVQ